MTNTSKSKKDLITKILAIVAGEVPPARHCISIMWEEDDPANEDNIYLIDGKKVNYEQWRKQVK